jgi:hypothetical protein
VKRNISDSHQYCSYVNRHYCRISGGLLQHIFDYDGCFSLPGEVKPAKLNIDSRPGSARPYLKNINENDMLFVLRKAARNPKRALKYLSFGLGTCLRSRGPLPTICDSLGGCRIVKNEDHSSSRLDRASQYDFRPERRNNGNHPDERHYMQVNDLTTSTIGGADKPCCVVTKYLFDNVVLYN